MIQAIRTYIDKIRVYNLSVGPMFSYYEDDMTWRWMAMFSTRYKLKIGFATVETGIRRLDLPFFCVVWPPKKDEDIENVT